MFYGVKVLCRQEQLDVKYNLIKIKLGSVYPTKRERETAGVG